MLKTDFCRAACGFRFSAAPAFAGWLWQNHESAKHQGWTTPTRRAFDAYGWMGRDHHTEYYRHHHRHDRHFRHHHHHKELGNLH